MIKLALLSAISIKTAEPIEDFEWEFTAYSYLKGYALKSCKINWQHFQISTKLKWQQACLQLQYI